MERTDNPRLRGHKLTEVFESESAWELTGRFQATTIQRMRSRDILSCYSAQRMLQSMKTLSHGMAYHVCEAVSRLPLRMSAHILGSMSGLVGSCLQEAPLLGSVSMVSLGSASVSPCIQLLRSTILFPIESRNLGHMHAQVRLPTACRYRWTKELFWP